MTLAPGQTLGSYEIVSPLGAGGMGEVWLARDSLLRRPAAIKVLRETNDESRRRFLHEARAVAALNHPNIVGIYEARDFEGAAYIAMEFVEGEPLTAKLKPKGLPLEQALDYLIPVASALEAAHKAGVVHRDIKPANVMVQPSGHVKLLDFGLAKRLPLPESDEPTLTALTDGGQVVGTIAYMSPEQAQGQEVDARSDVFSFGAMAYELFSGQRPFRGDTPISTLGAIVHSDPSSLSTASHGRVPAEASSVIMRCLRKDRARRFQTFSDLRVALEDLKAEESGKHSVVPAARRLWPWAAALVFAVALAAAGYRLSHRTGGDAAPVRPLTFDGTLNVTPALSPDGKLLAFASDRGSRGNLDIWLRQTAGGGLIHLTSQPGVEAYPRFSPDGTKVLYMNGAQTIFEAPALGGPSRQIVENAGPFDVSPQGNIAFAKLRPGQYFAPIFEQDEGGARRRLPGCTAAGPPSWSADGKSLLFFGECAGQGRGAFRGEVASGTVTTLFTNVRVASWISMFAVRALDSGDEALLYLDQLDQFEGGIKRLLAGTSSRVTNATGWQRWPALSHSGQVVFAELNRDIQVRMQPEQVRSQEAPAAATIVSAVGHFGVSRDGQTLVYGRLTGGASGELVVRNLITNEERVFASHDLLGVSFGALWPQVSPTGDRVVYRVVGEKGGIYILRISTNEVRRLGGMEDLLQLPSDWSADGTRVFGECPGARAGICELNPQSGLAKPVFVHPRDQLIYPAAAADGTSLVFMRRLPGAIAGIWTARFLPGGELSPETEWIRISPEGVDGSRPRFGTDGNSVYYVSGQEGLRLLVKQQLNARTGHPDGPPRVVAEEPMERPILTGGVGPYPLIHVTKRGIFYSTFVERGHLYTTNLN